MKKNTVKEVMKDALEIAGSILLFGIVAGMCYLLMIVTDYHWC